MTEVSPEHFFRVQFGLVSEITNSLL